MMRWVILSLFVCGSLAAQTPGRYVSTTGVDANNDGRNPALPLATVQKAATLAIPGDTIYISGGTYTGRSIISCVGTAASPIVFTAQAPCTLISAYRAQSTCSLYAAQYVEFRGITFREGRTLVSVSGSSRRVTFDECNFVDTTAYVSGDHRSMVYINPAYHITFNGCMFRGGWRTWGTSNDETLLSRGNGVYIYASDTILVSRCTFQWLEHWAVVGTSGSYGARNPVVLGCTFRDIHGAINTGTNKRIVARFNTISHSNFDAYTSHQGGAFQISADSSIIAYNIVYHDTTTTSTKYLTFNGQVHPKLNPAVNNRGARWYNNTIWNKLSNQTTTIATTFHSMRDNNTVATPTNVLANARVWNTLFMRGTRPFGEPDSFITLNDANQTIGSWETHFAGNMFWKPAATNNYFLRWKGSWYSLAAAKLADTTAWKSTNTLAYPTHLDTTSRSFEITDPASNLIDAGENMTHVVELEAGTGDWVRVADPLWFFDGRGVVPADSLRIGSDRVLLSRIGGDTLFLADVGEFSVYDTVNVLAAWDGEKYRATLSGDRPDIGAVEYGQSTAALPTGTLAASQTEITGPTSITFTYTSTGADSLSINGSPAMSDTNGDTTFTVSASGTYTLTAYYDGGQSYNPPGASVHVTLNEVTDNLLNNGSFERSTGWLHYDNGGTGNAYTRQTLTVAESTYAAKITFDDTLGTNNQLYSNSSQYLAVEAGKTYQFTCYAKSEPVGSDSFMVRILDYTAPYTLYATATKFVVTSDWTECTLTFTSPATDATAYVQFLFYVSGIAAYQHGAGDRIYIDAVTITEVEPPSAPTLVSPITAAETDSGYTVCYWTPGGSVANHLQVDNDPAFDSPNYDNDALTDDNQQVTGLTKGTTYYWRVRIKSSAGWSSYSGIDSLTIRSGVPTTPALVYPADGEANISITPTIYWTDGTGASQHLYQVSTSSEFEVPSLVAYDSTMTGSPEWYVPLQYNTQYWWRVRAKNADGYSSWSDVKSFVTGTRMGLATDKRAR